jgi:hypothetical protein
MSPAGTTLAMPFCRGSTLCWADSSAVHDKCLARPTAPSLSKSRKLTLPGNKSFPACIAHLPFLYRSSTVLRLRRGSTAHDSSRSAWLTAINCLARLALGFTHRCACVYKSKALQYDEAMTLEEATEIFWIARSLGVLLTERASLDEKSPLAQRMVLDRAARNTFRA